MNELNSLLIVIVFICHRLYIQIKIHVLFSVAPSDIVESCTPAVIARHHKSDVTSMAESRECNDWNVASKTEDAVEGAVNNLGPSGEVIGHLYVEVFRSPAEQGGRNVNAWCQH